MHQIGTKSGKAAEHEQYGQDDSAFRQYRRQDVAAQEGIAGVIRKPIIRHTGIRENRRRTEILEPPIIPHRALADRKFNHARHPCG